MKNRRPSSTRREFIELSAAGAAGLALRGRKGWAESKRLPELVPMSNRPRIDPTQAPNIILLFSDQHRYDAMGCTGNPVVQTPHLDALAARGINLTKTHCASPICQPSRASILTGLYPHQHGVTFNDREQIDPNLPTMPRRLQKAGYRTAIIGKTHFWNPRELAPVGGAVPDSGIDARVKEDYVRHFGFDDVIEEFDLYVHAFPGVEVHTHYTDYLEKMGSLNRYKKQIQSVWRTTKHHWDGQTSVLPQEQDETAFITRNAIDWIRQRDRSRPFFLNIGYVAPHVPMISDPVWAAYYSDKTIPLGPPDFPEKPNGIWGKWLDKAYTSSNSDLLTREYVMNSARHYYGRISLIDQGIGEIVRALEEQGIAHNTWIIYSSDHGEMLGGHKLMGKTQFYKASVRVPHIIAPPNGTAPKTVDAPIEGVDIPATILDIAGAEPLENSSGQSLLPTLTGAQPEKEVAFSELGPTIDGQTRLFVSAATRRYRVTYEATTGTPCELFDLQEDPDELRNRVNDPELGRLRDQMIHEVVQPHINRVPGPDRKAFRTNHGTG